MLTCHVPFPYAPRTYTDGNAMGSMALNHRCQLPTFPYAACHPHALCTLGATLPSVARVQREETV